MFKTSLFPNLITDLIVFGIMIHISPKLCTVPSPTPRSCQDQGHKLKIFMLKFYVKVFRISLLLNQMMDSVPVFVIMIGIGQKFFISTISTHDHDLVVEVTDLEFKC